MGEYNTTREAIILKEYGRNVQNLVNYIRTIPEKEKRTKMATLLIELIKQLAPVAKDAHESPQRMWDDLYIMADFVLDVDHPYNVPDRSLLFKKPMKMEYPQSNSRFCRYGKNVEYLIQEAVKKEDEQERARAAGYLGRLMKTFYMAWHRESLDNATVAKDMNVLSGGKLTIDADKIKDEIYVENRRKTPQQHQNVFEKRQHQHRSPNNGERNGSNSNRQFNNRNRNRR